MKYLVIGAGGTGGSIGAYMTEAGKDVTLIARGEHLKKMQEQGLKMETTRKGNYTVNPVKATDMAHYDEQPDIIFDPHSSGSYDAGVTLRPGAVLFIIV